MGGRNWTFAGQFPLAQVTGYTWATEPCQNGLHCNKQDLAALANSLVQTGPASICINAGAWNFYTGGIMSASSCGGNGMYYVDHCVQLVGYHQEFANPKKSYWLVRNSWGSNWGENGYIRLQLNGNPCGVANEATHAVIAPEQHTSDAYKFESPKLSTVVCTRLFRFCETQDLGHTGPGLIYRFFSIMSISVPTNHPDWWI